MGLELEMASHAQRKLRDIGSEQAEGCSCYRSVMALGQWKG